MERAIGGLRRSNDELERAVRGWRAEWGREMEVEVGLGLGLGPGPGLPRADEGKDQRKTSKDDDDDAIKDAVDGGGVVGLADIERELDLLDEWVRIVEGDDLEQEREQEQQQGQQQAGATAASSGVGD